MKSKIEKLGKVSITVEKEEHTSSKTYNRLVIVNARGGSYISRKAVPAGIPITNEIYWKKLISGVSDLIPEEASPTNKLADKDYVNNGISTATATFRGTVYNVEDLNNIQVADANDYAFVVQRKEQSTVNWNWYSNNPEGIRDITIEGIGATGTIPSTDADFTINVKGATEETYVRVAYTTDTDNYPCVGLSKGTQLLVPVKTVGDTIMVRGRDHATYIPITIDGVRKYGSSVAAHTVTLEDVERGYVVIEAVEDCLFRTILYMVFSNVAFHRYKYANGSWRYEYTLDNSYFTAAQWDAINSNITSALVNKLNNLPNSDDIGNISSLETVVKTSIINAINEVNTIAKNSINKIIIKFGYHNAILELYDTFIERELDFDKYVSYWQGTLNNVNYILYARTLAGSDVPPKDSILVIVATTNSATLQIVELEATNTAEELYNEIYS